MRTMDTETIAMEKGKKIPGTGRGTGRRRGSKNKLTIMTKRSAAEIFKTMLGINDEAVEATGMINGEGYGFRLRFSAMLNGQRPVKDTEFLSAAKLALAYAVGTPGRQQAETSKRESLVFIGGPNGLYPWDVRLDKMKPKTDRMLAEAATEQQGKAIEAKAETVDADKADRDSEVPESLEVVNPPEEFGGRR